MSARPPARRSANTNNNNNNPMLNTSASSAASQQQQLMQQNGGGQSEAECEASSARQNNIRTRYVTATWSGSLRDFADGKNLSCSFVPTTTTTGHADSAAKIDGGASAAAASAGATTTTTTTGTARVVNWTPASQKDVINMFGISGHIDGTSAERQCSLDHVRLHSVRLMNASSTLAIPTAVTFPGVKGKYMDGYSTHAAAVIHTSGVSQPVVMQEKAGILDSTFANAFPGITSDNLDAGMIVSVPNSSSKLVHMDHPVISMLRSADAQAGAEHSPVLSASPTVGGSFFMVSSAEVDAALDILRKEVVSLMPETSMRNFAIGLSRADGEHWGTQIAVPHDGTAEGFAAEMKKIHTVSATFETTFELPPVTRASSAPAA